MKYVLYLCTFFIGTAIGWGQVAYIQERVVPNDHVHEFIEKETKYWAKVAKTAIDKGQLGNWSIWQKLGVDKNGAATFLFVSSYAGVDEINPSVVWSEENVSTLGVSPDMASTSDISSVASEYWVQIEDRIDGDFTYAILNYGKPVSAEDFIQENKKLWKPFHHRNINSQTHGMVAWELMSVIYPQGNLAKYSIITMDGFNSLADVLDYLRIQRADEPDVNYQEVISKSIMGEILPEGFEERVIYEHVHSVE